MNDAGSMAIPQAERELHDPLTGLATQHLFRDRLEQAIAIAARNGRMVPVVWLRLNRFERVLDHYGEALADRVLHTVAERITLALRRSDSVGRLGHADFAAILLSAEDLDNAIAVTRRVIAAVEEPISHDGAAVAVKANLGVAFASDRRPRADDALTAANATMREAAARGISFEVDTTGLGASDIGDNMMAQLRQAVDADGFEFHYQPKVSLNDGKVWGVEALVRWPSPTRGIVQPGDFIPLIENSPMLDAFTLLTVRKGIAKLDAWRQNGPDLSVAVNLSPKALHDAELADAIVDEISRANVPPDKMIIEITENALLGDTDRAITTLTRLCSLGLAISIDDFGIGYSSLSRLRDLPVAEIKIDQSFVRSMNRDRYANAIVKTVIGLAESLDLRVIAEGVESADIHDELRALGCGHGQGFLFARPLAEAALHDYLAKGN